MLQSLAESRAEQSHAKGLSSREPTAEVSQVEEAHGLWGMGICFLKPLSKAAPHGLVLGQTHKRCLGRAERPINAKGQVGTHMNIL